MLELSALPLVAIVGRPNVGKSTLFNRLIQRREAIVHDQPGVTRDRKITETEWEGKPFQLMDTGGFIRKSTDQMEAGVTEQVELAIDSADLILFLVDAVTGITEADAEVAALLRKSGKTCLLVVNKADNAMRELEIHEFERLGLGTPKPVSASLGRGIGDLLSEIVTQPGFSGQEQPAQENSIRLAIVGRPNAGKSTFINTILGENRVLVTEIPGTTRDTVDVSLTWEGHRFTLIDTAGLRRKSRIKESVEFYSGLRTRRVIESCDIVCVFVDAVQEIAQQDMRVIREAVQAKKGIILVLNKWDLVKSDEEKVRNWLHELKIKLRALTYIPVLRMSSKTGFRVKQVMETAIRVTQARGQRLPSPLINQMIEKMNRQLQHPSVGGKRIRVMYGTQPRANPPAFVFFCNHPRLVKPSYKRFVEKQIREAGEFQGVPLTLSFKQK